MEASPQRLPDSPLSMADVLLDISKSANNQCIAPIHVFTPVARSHVVCSADQQIDASRLEFQRIIIDSDRCTVFSRPSGVPLSREEKIQARHVSDRFSELHYKTDGGGTASGDVSSSSLSSRFPVDFRRRRQARCERGGLSTGHDRV